VLFLGILSSKDMRDNAGPFVGYRVWVVLLLQQKWTKTPWVCAPWNIHTLMAQHTWPEVIHQSHLQLLPQMLALFLQQLFGLSWASWGMSGRRIFKVTPRFLQDGLQLVKFVCTVHLNLFHDVHLSQSLQYLAGRLQQLVLR
jgi:hypothetical protein